MFLANQKSPLHSRRKSNPGTSACNGCCELNFSAERIPFTTKTIIEPKTLMGEIEQASKNGFADCKSGKNSNTVSIASAILNDRNEPIGAVELTGAWEKLRWAKKGSG